MRKFFLKHCSIYRRLIHELFGFSVDGGRIHIPFDIYGNFDYHYLGYDEKGNVKKGFKTLVEALRNRGNLGLTVLYDKY